MSPSFFPVSTHSPKLVVSSRRSESRNHLGSTRSVITVIEDHQLELRVNEEARVRL